MKNFFSSPTFALRYLVIAWLSGGTNNLHFATHFSAQKVANVKNYLYFCTRFRLRHSALQMPLCVIKAQRGLGFSPPQTLRWFVSGTPGKTPQTAFGLACVGDPWENTASSLWLGLRRGPRVWQGGHQLATIFLNFADLGNQKRSLHLQFWIIDDNC